MFIQSVHGIIVSVAQNFFELQSGKADYCYLAFEELSRFVHCLLLKTKVSSSLPVIKKWTEKVPSNHLCFAPIAQEHFLEGTRLSAALEKVNSVYLRAEFQNNRRQFLYELVSIMLSTVAARFLVGQGLTCFSPVILVGGDDYSAFYLFGQLIDGLLNLGWVKGSDVEAAKVEFHSFVREQRQIEQRGNLSVRITDVFSFCCGQPGVRSCHHLNRVSI